MSAPLFLVDALPPGDRYTLDGAEGHHAATVQRLKAGEVLLLADGRGGTAGDLYVEIHERPHDVYSRKGDDLHCRVTLPMTAAALGTRMTIKTLDSEEQIEVKPGTQPGATLRIRGKGVPHLRAQHRGDLFVHLDVRTPTKLTSDQERMLRDFAKTRGEDIAELSKQGGFFSRMRDAFNGH